jgi:hypothetical protein
MSAFIKIGKGASTTAYKSGNTVYLKSDCPAKECMAHGWFPNSRLFPKVKFSDEPGFDYEMKYYPAVRSLKKALKPAEWDKYKVLRDIFDHNSYIPLSISLSRHWMDKFKTIKIKPLRLAMIEAMEAMMNYGENIGFEISPRNVRVSRAGNLILLDCFYQFRYK